MKFNYTVIVIWRAWHATRNGAYRAGGKPATDMNFRQTAPEIHVQSPVCGAFMQL
jgi:hypothetical protein